MANVTINDQPPIALPIDSAQTFVVVDTPLGTQIVTRRVSLEQINGNTQGVITGTGVDNPANPGGTFNGFLEYQNQNNQVTGRVGFDPAGDLFAIRNFAEGGQVSIDVRDGSSRFLTRDFGAQIPTTGAFVLPVGTTAEEPVPENGMIRYDSDTNGFRGVIAGAWVDLDMVGGQVNSVQSGTNITVDSADPINPIVKLRCSPYGR